MKLKNFHKTRLVNTDFKLTIRTIEIIVSHGRSIRNKKITDNVTPQLRSKVGSSTAANKTISNLKIFRNFK